MKQVDAGRLNRLVTFRSKGTTLNAYGEPDHTSYTSVITTWAQVEGIKPMERFVASSDHPFQVVSFRTRYRPDLDEDMVLEYNGYRYDISGIKAIGQRAKKYLIVTAIRVDQITV